MNGGTGSYGQQLTEALAFIRERDDFLVVSHVQPDGDAISSSCVVQWLLDKLGKKSAAINEGAVPNRLIFLDKADGIINWKAAAPERTYKSIITVDCADFQRIGAVSALFAEGYELLNIDHHPTNDGFGTVNAIRTEAAATVEVLYDLIQQAAIPLDLGAAISIYTGLLTDTGGFRYSNTSPHVMEIASHLLAIGVNGHKLADELLERMTMPQLKLLQRGLSRLMFSEDGRLSWLYITPADLLETGAAGEDLEGLVNYARNIDGVEIGILFKETGDGAIKASLRSAGQANVAAIAQSFGGGGHVRAAGCRLDGPLEAAISRIVQASRKAMEQ